VALSGTLDTFDSLMFFDPSRPLRRADVYVSPATGAQEVSG
jgi:hypothetical protein